MNAFGDIKFRHFLSDKLMDKNVLVINGRKLSAQKIAPMVKEYTLLYNSDPVLDYGSVKYNYTNFTEELKTKRNELKAKVGKGSEKYKKKNKPKKFDKYLHPNWRCLRLQVLERDNNSCIECGSKSKLHCHHTYYVNGFKIWEYPISSLQTLCEICHNKFHDSKPGSSLVRNPTDDDKKFKRENFPTKNKKFKKNKTNRNKPKYKSDNTVNTKTDINSRYAALRRRQAEYEKSLLLNK